MKITLVWIGKTKEAYLKNGYQDYVKRLSKYCQFHIKEIPYIKKKVSIEEQKKMEGALLLDALSPFQRVILLDETGKHFSSVKFAELIETHGINGGNNMAFVIGGAYGFSDEVYQKYPRKMSISELTFSHQMIRLMFIEQLYRAHTIINNEPYHHL